MEAVLVNNINKAKRRVVDLLSTSFTSKHFSPEAILGGNIQHT